MRGKKKKNVILLFIYHSENCAQKEIQIKIKNNV